MPNPDVALVAFPVCLENKCVEWHGFHGWGLSAAQVCFSIPCLQCSYSCFSGILLAGTLAEEVFAVSPSSGVFEAGAEQGWEGEDGTFGADPGFVPHCSPGPGGKNCRGASVEHTVCENLPCPKGAPSFRDQQCQAHDRYSNKKKSLLTAVIMDGELFSSPSVIPRCSFTAVSHLQGSHCW